ncbi:MAG: DUF3368 domain-containing protein [Candidatus Verstraetearchaeota archaeon]|nr:DUF3368 domain-containing protein [Candidatus Verstraetearchaeota archaeon]
MRKGLLGSSNAALVIVSNTSPLIALKHAEILHALGLLLKSVVVPPAVLAELKVKEEEVFSKLEFLQVIAPQNKEMVFHLKRIVDEGEAEAITLAVEHSAWLLIDDLKGRKVARRLGVKVVGTLGILKIAKQKEFLSDVGSAIKRMKARGFYIADEIVDRFLKEVDEEG